MSDDKDEIDASDWLSGQFEPTAQVPKQPAPTPPPAQPPVRPVFPTSPPPPARAVPPVTPTPAGPTSNPPAPSAPASSAPTPQAQAPAPSGPGAFNWGLRPSAATDAPPPVQPPLQPPAQQPEPTEQPLPAQPPAPTQQYQSAPPPLVEPAPPAPTVPSVDPYDGPATQPMSWEEFAATQAPVAAPPPAPPVAPSPSYEQPTQAYTVQPWDPFGSPTSPPAPPAEPTVAVAPPAGAPMEAGPAAPTSAIDSLFGDTKFQEYDEVGVLQQLQVPTSDGSVRPPREPRAPLQKQQKILMGIAGGLVGILVLVGLFLLGTKMGTASADQPTTPPPSGAPSAAPTSAGTGGPAATGVQSWSVLQGGECIQPFSNAWAATFTIVPCTDAHTAEMVFKGTLPNPAGAPYPTSTAFQTEITPLCSSKSAINYTAAAAVTDVVLSFSYPATADSWAGGARTYYCFVNRQSGGNLPGDLSVPAK